LIRRLFSSARILIEEFCYRTISEETLFIIWTNDNDIEEAACVDDCLPNYIRIIRDRKTDPQRIAQLLKTVIWFGTLKQIITALSYALSKLDVAEETIGVALDILKRLEYSDAKEIAFKLAFLDLQYEQHHSRLSFSQKQRFRTFLREQKFLAFILNRQLSFWTFLNRNCKSSFFNLDDPLHDPAL